MNPAQIAGSLAKIVSGWTSDPNLEPGSLELAQKAIVSSLALGVQPAHIQPAASTITPSADVIQELTQYVESTPQAIDPTVLASVANYATLDPNNPGGLPPYARGMKVRQVAGPFVDAGGMLHIVNIFSITAQTSVAVGTSSAVLGVFPVTTSSTPGLANQLNLGAGSVWFLAETLVGGLPANAFTGFLISGGTLKGSANFQLQSGVYVLPAGASMTLTATLAPPAAPAGGSSIGQDAEALTVHLPASVTIDFTQTGGVPKATVAALASSSATVYGTAFTLTRNAAAPISILNGAGIAVPCSASIANFSFASVKSTQFTPSGAATVTSAGWALPVALTTVSALGVAAGAGSLMLALGASASASWPWHPAATPVLGWEIFADPTQIIAIMGGQAPAPVLTTYQLWPEMAPSTRNSSVDFYLPQGFLVTFVSTPGTESLTSLGGVVAHFDRPLAADGNRYAMAAGATIGLTLTGSGTRLTIVALQTAPNTAILPIALENALVGVASPFSFVLEATLTGLNCAPISLTTLFNATWLLPTLPDPYATSLNEDIGQQAALTLYSRVAWIGASHPVNLTFVLGPSTASAAGGTGLTGSPTAVVARGPAYFALLDLSTNADLFGVAVMNVAEEFPGLSAPVLAAALPAAPSLGITDLTLGLNGATCGVFALPQVSWEPMETTAGGPITLSPPGDGPPLLLIAPDQQELVPLAPRPVLLQTINNVSNGLSFGARFSLPFGLTATIVQPNKQAGTSTRQSAFLAAGGEFQLNQPAFPSSITGALQLTLKPENPTNISALFPGSTTLDETGANPGVTPPILGYGETVLSNDVATIFTSEFSPGGNPSRPMGPGVPLQRIDLAGYGASVFSEWADNTSPTPRISKADFDVIRGRTAFEVVQAASLLYPYGVNVVRTITIQRQSTGMVFNADSGWRASSPGLFTFGTASNITAHRGPVGGVFNVKNIRDQPLIVPITYGTPPLQYEFTMVLFDADIGLDHRVTVLQGGSKSTLVDASNNPVSLVPASDLVGYVQIAPAETPADANVLNLLFEKTGPVTAAFACVAEIGSLGAKSGTRLHCSAIEVAMATASAASPPPLPAVGAALRSAPVLPQDGAWGFGQRVNNAPSPSPLPQNFPVPIVQSNSDTTQWHVADIADLLQLNTPSTVYGLLQDTGTQKLLFEQPRIPVLSSSSPPGSVPGINLPNPPAFADIASLLNATGLFPDLSSSIPLVSYSPTGTPITAPMDQLQNVGDSLQYTKTISFDPKKPALTLLDLGVLSVSLAYSDVSQGRDGSGNATAPTQFTYTLNPAGTPRWSFDIENLSFLVYVPEFSSSDALLTIIGGLKADDQHAPALSNLNLVYGEALSTLKSIFSKLQALAAFLPGGAGAGLDISLSDGKLTVTDTFALPTLPLGLGDLSDISLDVGLTLTLSPLSADFSIGIGDPGNPFNWIVSPLSGNGLIDVGVQGGQPSLTVQGGIGLGLAIDLAVASGSASITIAVQLTISGSSITVIFILNGQASVDVLGGLASASLSLTASVGISVSPLPIPHLLPPPISFPSEDITFLASVSVGIHISICWVININFDGSWQFSQSIHTPALSI